MWFRRRRRAQPPPLLLPSLDRLAELVERVVALLDQVSLAPEPMPAATVRGHYEPEPVAATAGWLAFVASPGGYRLLERDGLPPDRGATVDLDGPCLVVRLGPSPLPGDRRRCAFVERQERPDPERTFDG